jgi:phosphatidylserine/phosphatidylglycerophosphate/cardiolipin synthase-like enzyme
MIFNRLFYAFALFALFQNTLSAQSIAIARAQPVGSTVTVRGIVTNGAELGKIRYLQDGTAGIAAFPGTGSISGFDTSVFPGDSIEVTGTLVDYHELLEISPINSFSIISSGNPLPKPKPISLAELSDVYESQLLEFECISFNSGGGTFNNGGSYTISDSEGATAKIYLRSGHPMLGSTIPAGPIRLTSILSAYDDFQLLPSGTADFATETCLYFVQKPVQSDIATTGFQLNWETSLPTNCLLHVGTDPNPNLQLPVTGYTAAHSYLVTNLQPGTIYWVQVEAEHNGGSIFSEPIPFATQSNSSGEVRVFFNKGLDPAFLNGFAVAGETKEAVLFETIERIDSAKQTIDVAVYNNNRSDITNALKAAHARGVRVRYIASLATSNTALNPTPAFPVLYGNTVTIMHNKFMVVDAELPDKAWVMGGSLNWTSQNVNTDFNNTLFIQDQSLARAYELEFEEMWGSDLLLPDTSKSRFGSAKRDNTPHQFIVGGSQVESYFSPTDQTTLQIETALRSAQSEALFGAFSFTKNELGNALVDVHDAGVPMRGIIENINDNGAEYQHLLNNGVNVRHHNLSGDFHHKYGVVDAIDWTSDPTVITGSHNWSVAAETENDENTLILHDPVLATLYKAEFEKRWGEFPSSVQTLSNSLLEVFPNPTTGLLELRGLPETSGTILVKNMLGQVLISKTKALENQSRINVSSLNPGQYFVTYISAHAVASVSFQKI